MTMNLKAELGVFIGKLAVAEAALSRSDFAAYHGLLTELMQRHALIKVSLPKDFWELSGCDKNSMNSFTLANLLYAGHEGDAKRLEIVKLLGEFREFFASLGRALDEHYPDL